MDYCEELLCAQFRFSFGGLIRVPACLSTLEYSTVLLGVYNKATSQQSQLRNTGRLERHIFLGSIKALSEPYYGSRSSAHSRDRPSQLSAGDHLVSDEGIVLWHRQLLHQHHQGTQFYRPD